MGRFLTVVGVSADLRLAETRADRFAALVENMEGFALALAGDRFGIKVGEVRGVSNLAGYAIRRRGTLIWLTSRPRPLY